jgi:hypothetical protein
MRCVPQWPPSALRSAPEPAQTVRDGREGRRRCFGRLSALRGGVPGGVGNGAGAGVEDGADGGQPRAPCPRGAVAGRIAAGELAAADVVLRGSWEAGMMSVSELDVSAPLGSTRVRRLLESLRVPESKPVGNLTARRRLAPVDALRRSGREGRTVAWSAARSSGRQRTAHAAAPARRVRAVTLASAKRTARNTAAVVLALAGG